MKKEIKIAIAVVLSIWFFVMGFEIGVYKERKAGMDVTKEVVNTVTPTQDTTAPTAAPTVAPTAAPTTLPTDTTAPTEAAPTTVKPSESAPANDPAALTKQQVIDKVNEYVTSLKKEQSFTAHKFENITVNITDCSVPAAINIINGVIEGIAGSEEADYVFTNGATANGETPFALVPPVNKDFLLTDAGVVSAVAEASGADTIYTVVLVAENTTIDKPVPTYNSTAIGYLDIASLELPAISLTKADMSYPGSTVKVTVNADGKVTKLINELPMTGYGEAQIAFMTGNANFDGSLNEEWTFTY